MISKRLWYDNEGYDVRKLSPLLVPTRRRTKGRPTGTTGRMAIPILLLQLVVVWIQVGNSSSASFVHLPDASYHDRRGSWQPQYSTMGWRVGVPRVVRTLRDRSHPYVRSSSSILLYSQSDSKSTVTVLPVRPPPPPPHEQNNITTLEQLNAHWDDPFHLYTKHKKKQRRRRQGGWWFWWRPSTTDHTTTTAMSTTDYDAILRAANVMGDTQIIGSSRDLNYTHSVVQLLHHRRQKLEQHHQSLLLSRTTFPSPKEGSTTTTMSPDGPSTINNHTMVPTNTISDGCKVALVIEGGGMRGCVSAGMVCAIHHLNLTDTIDTVYGSSAGTIVGAYFVAKQLPYFGPEVYYDRLTTAGRRFIDTKRLLRALGLGLFDPRLFRDVMTRRKDGGKPVLNLPFLLKTTVQDTKPLDWETFVQRQTIQPLNVVVSGLNCERSIVFNMGNHGFTSLDELTDCMHASCLLPGITGPVMNVDRRILDGTYDPMSNNSTTVKKLVLGNNLDPSIYEPMADALLYEPIPYRTAITKDNVTHCIVLRSRPDGTDVTGKGGRLEKLIFKRFFQRKNQLSHQYRRMQMHLHKKIYGEDIIRLNEDAYNVRDCYDTQQPHLLTIAVPPGSPEVGRLEVRRQFIFDGLRRGFARAYDCLVDDPNERGRGLEVAQQYFPDEILDYDPLLMDLHSLEKESAFATYMRLYNVQPKAWNDVKDVQAVSNVP
jgi:predicted acylesterase/phospholipase RssA